MYHSSVRPDFTGQLGLHQLIEPKSGFSFLFGTLAFSLGWRAGALFYKGGHSH
jgi:hypothetical protein